MGSGYLLEYLGNDWALRNYFSYEILAVIEVFLALAHIDWLLRSESRFCHDSSKQTNQLLSPGIFFKSLDSVAEARQN